ncbi:SurA N-terminal domain-containing protein [bacterium]|nr:SurA N-terminal domain-containing protein [bacterium]
MLNLIRDNVQSFGIKFIVGVVVVVMAFFGVSTYRSQSSNTIVTVDGYEVKIDKYQRAYENKREEIRSRYGDRASEYIKMINLEGQIVHQLTNAALVLKSAEVNGLAVSDKELAHEIYNMSAFMTDERFDPDKYKNSLKNMRTEKLAYEKDLKESLTSRKLFRFISTGALFSRSSLEQEYRRYESELSVKVIEFNPSLFTDQATLSDQELAEYYDLNKSTFQQKSQYALNYFVLDIDDVKDKVVVRDKEISHYYEANKETEFTNKESFLSRHILISTANDAGDEELTEARKKADQIYSQIIEQPDQFAALAKKYSDDSGSATKGGDLGWVEKGSFVAEFESAIDLLKKNEISKPFKSAFGYHIVELVDRKEAEVQPFEAVKENIKLQITINKAKRRLMNQVEKLQLGTETKPLAEIAQSLNKTVEKTETFDDTKNLKKIGYSYQLYQKLGNATLNQKDQYALAGDQQIIVYEVAEIIEPFVKPLEEVKETVKYYAIEEKKRAIAAVKLELYSKEIKSLKEFDNLALTLKTNAIDARFKFSDREIKNLGVSNKFKIDVFKMEKDQVRAVKDGDRAYLVYLIDKKSGELTEENKQTLTLLGNMMRQQKAEVVLNGFIVRLRTQVDVDYNMPLLNAMNVRLDS